MKCFGYHPVALVVSGVYERGWIGRRKESVVKKAAQQGPKYNAQIVRGVHISLKILWGVMVLLYYIEGGFNMLKKILKKKEAG